MNSAESPLQVDIVIPVYNEEEAVARFHASLVEVLAPLPCDFHLLYVNDGSSDRTQEILEELAATDPRITIVELSRNFGHQAALSAGLDLAHGDVVITMDGDGQHPPALLPKMLSAYHGGYDVVLMQRMGRESISFFKRWSAFPLLLDHSPCEQSSHISRSGRLPPSWAQRCPGLTAHARTSSLPQGTDRLGRFPHGRYSLRTEGTPGRPAKIHAQKDGSLGSRCDLFFFPRTVVAKPLDWHFPILPGRATGDLPVHRPCYQIADPRDTEFCYPGYSLGGRNAHGRHRPYRNLRWPYLPRSKTPPSLPYPFPSNRLTSLAGAPLCRPINRDTSRKSGFER